MFRSAMVRYQASIVQLVFVEDELVKVGVRWRCEVVIAYLVPHERFGNRDK